MHIGSGQREAAKDLDCWLFLFMPRGDFDFIAIDTPGR